ncbi:MAG TPA: acetyl-CoA hydrolase/transferase C-terminal domain-containing protein [Desulfobacteraceae bacterium]|nr:acetyl-CoA hydrolase/transferase C-terminal domain-containing protein [Desulfobacteraceae bacterium]HPJ68007.1 acetyl-CoA hydrolase/transferase C-terminal domain-containing protein [Desulfobacteraceae bacterium]
MDTYYLDYKKKLTTAQKAAEIIKNGDTIVHGLTIAEPPALLAAIAARCREGDLKDINIFSLLPLEHAGKTVLSPDLCDVIRAYSWFVSGSDRALVKVGLSYFIPNYFHQIPKLCREFMGIDVAITTVSPMDKAGYFSFGTANDFTSTAARHCKTLILEVNENMPRVFGDSLIHISEVHGLVENNVPLLEMKPPEPRAEDKIIGKSISDMVPDGATLQLGIGGLPNAVTENLMGHRDLGIHTEVFGPGMVDLIKNGVVTGRRKNTHRFKNVFTVAQGTREMYDFMNDNPSMESYPVSYTNDPAVIARNDNVISINSVLEVDLLGQCNAESLGGSQFSGTGGQLDFVRGAFNSKGGKSILAFYSTAHKGKISRVVPRLETGAVVTTPRMDTHYLVTEYGFANLKGKSTRERALDIIGLAHPRFRDDLLKEAENMYLI